MLVIAAHGVHRYQAAVARKLQLRRRACSASTTCNSVCRLPKPISPFSRTHPPASPLCCSVFPGVMDQIPYRGDLGASLDLPALAANGNAWWSTILLATFNICDTIGRTLPARLICVKERWLLVRSVGSDDNR